MVHPYPPHHDDLPYVGKYHYSLTFCTDGERPAFANGRAVELVLAQFLRAAGERRYDLTAYCFMPDHMHLIASGLSDDSDLKWFVAAAKQYSGYYFKSEFRLSLWQRYGFERFIRDEMELAHDWLHRREPGASRLGEASVRVSLSRFVQILGGGTARDLRIRQGG
jgi:REP element-mobilizing transposase RayT